MANKALIESGGDGTAVPSGAVGEKITATLAGISQLSPPASTIYEDTGTLTLSAGTWRIVSSSSLYCQVNSVAGSAQIPIYMGCLRQVGFGTLVDCYAGMSPPVNSGYSACQANFEFITTISTSTQFRQGISWIPNSGSPTVNSIATNASRSYLYAVRIA
jgi:hypothetical protein